MLNKLIIRNFKRFDEVKVELGDPVVFIGPNNSGKTSALQALALWDIGLKRWCEKRGDDVPEKRSGVAINRRDLVTVPVPFAKLLWKDLHVRDVRKTNGKPDTKNVCIEIIVEGITSDHAWQCGLEFDFANDESFYCRPLRINGDKKPSRMDIPDAAGSVKVAFLPPMSGLAANEDRLESGSIKVRIGEGRTAEVVRNLCHSLANDRPDQWGRLHKYINNLFGIDLDEPKYIADRGEITMSYRERGNVLDLSSCGRGLHQTLLLLAYMYNNPGAVLLLDEPDAHLEILRQRQIYQVLTDVARENGNQLLVASHSEVLLNEAADRDVVVAFVGKTPHRINDKKGSQVRKSLQSIGFDKYYQAEQTGWILFLEGSSDLAILRAFAQRLNHEKALQVLERPFIDYVENKPIVVCDTFYGLREAVRDLKGLALFDRLDQEMPSGFDGHRLKGLSWSRREIENYFCYPETLRAYAEQSGRKESAGDLFSVHESGKRLRAMNESIEEITLAMKTLKKGSPWDVNTKVSDDFLDPLFENYFGKLNMPNLMAKKNFHELVPYVPVEKIDSEVREKLDSIVQVANSAKTE